MSVFINSNKPVQEIYCEENETYESSRYGERIAAAMLISYTTTFLAISAWSLLVMLSGNIESGGPIGLCFKILQTSGII